MIFKIDENLPEDVAIVLREGGFGAHTVHDEGLAGASDRAISETAHREGRVLITLDRDFSDIRAYPPSEHSGIIILSPRQQDKLISCALNRRSVSCGSSNPTGSAGDDNAQATELFP